MTVSIVVSVYNEEAVIEHFHSILSEQTAKIAATFEFIFVNDGSTDASATLIDQLAQTDGRITGIHLSRNFGHEAAMLAGIDHSHCDAVICMDSDLQHPPALIANMLAAFEQGNDIVTTQRTSRADGGLFKRLSSNLFYKTINKLSNSNLQPNVSDFFLISKRVAHIIQNDLRERTRFLRGLIQNIGFKTISLPYEAPARSAGHSKYTPFKLIEHSLTAICSFSKAPLKIGIYIGLGFGLLSIVLIAYSLTMWIIERPVAGYTTLIIFLSTFAAALFVILGLIGYYIGFIFDEVKQRPIYLIDRIKQSPSKQ